MSTTSRLVRLERRQRQIDLHASPEYLWDEAVAAYENATASLEQYALVLAEDVRNIRATHLSSVPVHVVIRRLAIGPGTYHWLQACAFPPAEALPAEVVEAIAAVRDRAEMPQAVALRYANRDPFSFDASPHSRAQHAAWFGVLGDEQGLDWRHSLWHQTAEGRWRLRPEVIHACESETPPASGDPCRSSLYDGVRSILTDRGAHVDSSGGKRYVQLVDAALRLATAEGGSPPEWSEQVRTSQRAT